MTETKQATAGRVVVQFDHHSPDIAVDPFSTYKSMHEQCPVVWSESYGGFWVLLGYKAVWQASRDDATFLSGYPGGVGIPDYPIRPQIPLESDAPMTQKFRGMLQHKFSPSAVKELEPSIQTIANQLVDEFIERGECDFISEFAQPLPARAVLRMLGFDEHRWAEFVNWIHSIVHNVTNDPDSAFNSAFALYEEIKALIAAKKEAGLTDDMVSTLLRAELDGEPFDEELAIDYILLLLFGGLDTTTGSLGNALIRIEQNPSTRARLIADPAAMDNAIEEFLRIDSPVQALARTVSKDTEVCGQELKAGDRALLVWAAADRDPEEFPEPDEVNLDRTDNRHLAFGVGLHRCLGSNLGRSMFRIMLETVMTRTPDFELTDDPNRHRYADCSSVYALHKLPARFTPGQRVG